ncbi:stalk domain-containing protein [Paenibacillus sp. DMB5]|uniref:stalk domain-containing protein n=1 Tax=Paenibacillus sp. DMB5 TaxID=1780103 RepID=UPI00076CC8FA|nr:stalk domain-containing protein [Paenibacillus sp. DMB5]KUP22046.1 hypothetical protein AWJ19_21285 [Paenibacillus sp. DMB5]
MRNNRVLKSRRFAVKASAVIMALTVIVGGKTTLAQAVATSPTAFTQVAVNVGGYEYNQANVNALNYLNDIRTKAGLPTVTLNPFLTKAASNHASYLGVNGSSDGHSEVSSKKGFTGESFITRIANAGGGDSFKYTYVDEGITFSANTLEEGVDSLIDAPYHRDALLDPNLTQIGFGQAGSIVVHNYAIEGSTTLTSVYPYNGQKDVPLTFDGFENPNPLEGTGLSTSGYIISYKVASSPSTLSATLKNSKGVSLPVIVKMSPYTAQTREYGYQYWMIIPKSPLVKGETYTITAGDKTWSFTTTGAVAPKPPVVNDQAPRKFSVKDVGVRIDGKYVELSPKAQVLSNSTFIPLRGVFEAMGATIKWSPVPTKDLKGSEIVITKGTTKIQLWVGLTKALVEVNGKTIAINLSKAPYVTPAGSTYVPLRFASEALGAKVGWDAKNFIASIDQQ